MRAKLKIAGLAAFATLAMTGTAYADEVPPNGDENQSSTVTGDQLQGGSAEQLPSDTKINVPSRPPEIKNGSAHPFDRSDTVKWALKNATANQDFPAACTWFVSRALWAGGIPRSDAWNDDGERGTIFKRPGTVSATAVEPLLDYLQDTYPRSELIHLDPKINPVPEAVPGDIVAYDWEGDGTWDHLALVTDIERGQYPVVSEWGTSGAIEFVDPGKPSDYQARGWTYSRNSGHWLQKSYPDMEVALLHIDTTLPNRF
jgi:hypothetical protein